MKSTKIRWMRHLGRPGGMRGGAGGRLEGGLRSADLRFAISDFCFRFDTPALAIRQGRRIPSAMHIPRGQTPNMYFLNDTPFWQVSGHMVMSIVLVRSFRIDWMGKYINKQICKLNQPAGNKWVASTGSPSEVQEIFIFSFSAALNAS